MWTEILNNSDIKSFLDTVCYFHDSCIKEMKYVSGAFVNENLSMYPVNDKRKLCVIIQRQIEDNSVIEIEFQGLKKLALNPVSADYTCEILDSTLIKKDDLIYWCDCGGYDENTIENYDGTLICAEKMRWRSLENALGK